MKRAERPVPFCAVANVCATVTFSEELVREFPKFAVTGRNFVAWFARLSRAKFSKRRDI